MGKARTLLASPLMALAWLACAGTPLVAAPDSRQWDVSKPIGKGRTIDFETDVGTWMSTDLSPDGKWIVFDLLGNIYRIAAAGGRAEQLTRNSGISVNYHPRYAPDGRSIVFVSDRSAQDNLWIMDADGRNPRPLLLDMESRFAEPSWSPDGRYIVATRRFKRPGMGFIVTTDTIWRIPVDGSTPEELLGPKTRPDIAEDRLEIWRGSNLWNGADRFQWPTVSPDGRFVYFHTSPYGGNPRRIQRLDLVTRRVQNVTETKDRYFGDCCSERPFPLYLTEIAPELSPDGKWLAFARRIPEGRVSYNGHAMTGRTALWLRNLQTGEDRVVLDPITRDAVTNLPNYQERVLPGYSWARDGKSILISTGGKIKRLWVETGKVETIPFKAHVQRKISEMARADVRLADGRFEPRFIRWPATSPDGRHLAFEAAGIVWLRPSAGGQPRALVKPAQNEVQLTPAWSPDGSKLVFTTAVDGQRGHVWIVDVSSGSTRRLSEEAGLYIRPSFSADGRHILLDRWPAALTRTSDANEWELVRMPIEGGPVELLARDKGASFGDPSRPGLRFYKVQSATGTELHRLDVATGQSGKILTVAGPTREFRLSPDGKWLALEQYQDVYLAPVGDATDVIDTTAPDIIRVTRKGGRYPHWRNAATLEMASAGQVSTYDLQSRTLRAGPTGLRLERQTARGTVLLQNATILTMDKRRSLIGSVLVEDGRIQCVGTCAAPASAKVIDLTGKTIMPGMLDVHAHSVHEDEESDIINLRRLDSAAYLAYGVTTIHDPFGSPVPQFAISDLVEAGRIIGPRSFSTGYALTCTGPMGPLRNIETFQDALDHVDRQASLGVLSIKDYLLCDRKQRQMIVQAARMRNMTVTSELGPLNYMLGQAMNGLTGWEHPLQYVLYDDVTTFLGQAGSTNSAQIHLSDFSNGPALEYWLSRNNLLTDPKARRWTSWERAVARRIFHRKPESEYLFPVVADGLRRLKRSGGHVALGAHGEVVGLGTHWELWTMAAAPSGLSNEEALEVATIETARFIGLDKDLGSIEPGKIADLIVLDEDPRKNIRHTLSLRYVMKAGRLFDADTLDEIWPQAIRYGRPSGFREDVLRTDTRQE